MDTRLANFLNHGGEGGMSALEGPKKGFIIIDYLLLFFAVIGNCLVLDSVSKLRFNLTGYRQFLLSLICSDLFVCGVNFLSFIYHPAMYAYLADLTKLGADVLRSLQLTGFIANLFNLTGMSIDHYIGIINPLRYNQVLCKRYVRILVALIWILSFVLGFADLIVASITDMLVEGDRLQQNDVFAYDSFNTSANLSLETIIALISKLLEQGDRSGGTPLSDILLAALISKGSSSHEESMSSESLEQFGDDGTMTAELETLKRLLESLLRASNTSDPFIFSSSEENDTSIEQMSIIQSITDAKRQKKAMSYSIRTSNNRIWIEFGVMSMTMICFIFLIVCYGRIFGEVSLKYNNTGANTRRLVITTCLMLGSFVICWMPFMSFELIMVYEIKASRLDPTKSTSFFAIHNVFNTMLMMSPLLDPIIYAWRMRVVQRYIPCIRERIDRIKFRNSLMSFGSASAGGNRTSSNAGTFYTHARNVLSGIYLEREGTLLRSNSDASSLRRPNHSNRCDNRNRNHNNNSNTNDSTNNNGLNPRSLINSTMFHSFDLSTIYRYIDDPDGDSDEDENSNNGSESVSKAILAQDHQCQRKNASAENNFLTVPPMLPVCRAASSPPINTTAETEQAPMSQPTAPMTPLYLRGNIQSRFADSEAVLAHFRVHSFNLIGAGAFGRNSVTLNCPTINH